MNEIISLSVGVEEEKRIEIKVEEGALYRFNVSLIIHYIGREENNHLIHLI